MALGTELYSQAKETWQPFAGAFLCRRRPVTSWWATKDGCLASASAAEPPRRATAPRKCFFFSHPLPLFPRGSFRSLNALRRRRGIDT